MVDETRWSLPWVERSAEEARIFNPAFCCELIGHTVGEYHRTRQVSFSMGNCVSRSSPHAAQDDA